MNLLLCSLFLLPLLLATSAFANPQNCTYDSYVWNVHRKSAIARVHVSKPYTALTRTERDSHTNCSVCQEDQTKLTLRNGKTVQVCTHLAAHIKGALNDALAQGAKIDTITGYRVGRTRGNMDADGNRTQFSNHSFGIAIDVNAAQNGLYGNCFTFGPQCQLRKGGPWQPNTHEGLISNSPIVHTMRDAGFKWGGEIRGRQKDFMHFSPSGY